MTLEKFKDVLIPIELVWYAYYDEDEGETAIVLSSPNFMGMSREIRLKPNCLNEFQEWYNGFKTVMPSDGSYVSPPVPPVVTMSDSGWAKNTVVCEVGRDEHA